MTKASYNRRVGRYFFNNYFIVDHEKKLYSVSKKSDKWVWNSTLDNNASSTHNATIDLNWQEFMETNSKLLAIIFTNYNILLVCSLFITIELCL